MRRFYKRSERSETHRSGATTHEPSMYSILRVLLRFSRHLHRPGEVGFVHELADRSRWRARVVGEIFVNRRGKPTNQAYAIILEVFIIDPGYTGSVCEKTVCARIDLRR